MKTSIKTKIIGIVVLAALIPTAVLLGISYFKKIQTLEESQQILENDAKNNLTSIAKDVYHILEVANNKINKENESSIALAEYMLEQRGGLSLSNSRIEWEAVNQYTKEVKDISIPQIQIGNTSIPKISSFDQSVPVLDKVQEIQGGTLTIFQRMNEEGDMLRIATNVKLLNGKRAIGTYIPAVNPDGTPNPVVSEVLKGNTYRGKAYVVNAWYQTVYKPLKDNQGNIIGILYSGIQQTEDEAIKQAIYDIRVGETGYVFVIGGSGTQKGDYIVSEGGERDGENILNAKDADGNEFIKEMIDKSLVLEKGENAFIEYPWKNPEDERNRDKVAALVYFEPWDWVIGAGSYKEEFNATADAINSQLNSMLIFAIIAGVIIMIIMSLFAFIFGRRMANPILKLANISEKMAKGDLSSNINIKSNDEIGQLADSFKSMKESLKNVISETNTLINSAVAGKLDIRGKSEHYEGEYRNIIVGVNNILDAVIGPLNVTAEYVDRISKGDIPPKIVEDYRGDYNEIKNNINLLIDSLSKFINDMNTMYEAQKAGDLDVYINADNFMGAYNQMANGVNESVKMHVDNLLMILNLLNEYAEGNFKNKLKQLPGKQAIANERMNLLRENLTKIIEELNVIIEASKSGNLSVRGDSSKFRGDYARIINGFNETLNALITPMNMAAEYIDRISKGDIPSKITDEYHGDYNEIKLNINNAIDVMNGLLEEINSQVDDVKNGRLDTQADASKFQGSWGSMVYGINDLNNAFVTPINKTTEYIGRISKGDIPEEITEEYKGDFNIIKDAINKMIFAISSIVTDINDIAENVSSGKLDFRSDNTKYSGQFNSIIMGLNGLVNTFEKILDTSNEFMIADKDGIINHVNTPVVKLLSSYENDLKKDMPHFKVSEIKGSNIDNYHRDNQHNRRILDALTNQHSAIIKIGNKVFNLIITPIFNEDNEKLGYTVQWIDKTLETNFQNGLLHVIDNIIDGNINSKMDENKLNGDYKETGNKINKMIELLTEPINEAGEILSILATGDLRARMTGEYKGDLEKLKHDTNLLAESLSSLILKVNDTVETTASSAAEISSTAESLAASSQEQSAQADEVASAVEQMSKTITENAMSANRTSEMAQENSKVASEGGEVVHQTVVKMRDIAKVVENSAENITKLGESSKQIGEIISVIDDIADQTNLLALNAAIEAARAGEQGRGFAVVADEVRKLAERTTDATKQIADMIKGIQIDTEKAVIAMNQGNEEVRSGIELADRAGESLESILSSTKEVLDMINQIAAANEQQSATSEQISKNVVSISKVTADSTRRVEDVASTSEDLARLTEHLSELMSQFQVDSSNSKLLKGNNESGSKLLE